MDSFAFAFYFLDLHIWQNWTKKKMKNILRIHYETNQLCSQSYIYEYVEKTMQMKNY